MKNSERFDTIILGGGVAGSVLAGRLSQESSRNILLPEAGGSLPETVNMTAM